MRRNFDTKQGRPMEHGGSALRAGLSSTFAALIFASSIAAAQAPGAAGITYGQPKVVPAEFNGDLSKLPRAPAGAAISQNKPYRPRLPGPPSMKILTVGPESASAPQAPSGPLAPMPSPIQNFAGLNFNDSCLGGQCGSGWPPDPNGDVGPNHYVEAVNTAIGIYNKTGTLLTSFTEDNLFAGTGAMTGQCAGNSQGDPVVIYDWLADRFVITWFAFPVDINNNPISPFFQCIAASKTSNPVTGGWWLYGVRVDTSTNGGLDGLPPVGDLNDYGKFGLWHDCLYMGANAFTTAGSYDGVMFASFSRADLYSGSALTFGLGWLSPTTNAFTLVPSNNQGKGANAVQPGTPNYFVSEAGSSNSFEVRKFTAGTNCGGGGTLSAVTNVSQAFYIFEQGAQVPQPNTLTKLDMIDDRIMQKVQYRKVGGSESLWVTHPVKNPSASNTAMQWAQLDVTGGTIATTPVQQGIHAPDTTLYRFMGSIAADAKGNVALGYTTSNGTSPNFPSVVYAGRLVSDPLGTLPQTEVKLIAGSGSQKFSLGGTPVDRWGDYSAMSVDPADDCTFWYVNQYYSSQTNGTAGNWQTRIGSFQFPSCTGLTPSSTALASSANPSIVGVSVTFTATVSGSAPTGNVNFTSDGGALCTAVALSGGGNNPTAQCSTGGLALGTHSIVASYGGDSANTTSTSTTLSQVVNPVPGSTLINASFEVPALGSGFMYNPSGAGVGWTFTPSSGIQGNGSAWGAAAAPSGTQTAFIQNTSSISQALSLNAGSYTLAFKAAQRPCCLTPNTQPIQVTVDGTQIGGLVTPASTSFASFNVSFTLAGTGVHTIAFVGTNPNTNATFIDAVTLTSITPGTALTSSPNPSNVGGNVTFTATVTGVGPTGSVTFVADSVTTLCSAVALSGGGNTPTAQCNTSSLTAGTHSIVASYSGDGSNAPSNSSALSQVVNTVVPPPALVNASFETPALGSGFQYNPSGAGVGWTFSPSSGIQGNGSAWGAAPAPSGTQTAFIQNTSTISQALSLNAGNYTLAFKAAQRPCCLTPNTQPIQVSVDGVPLGAPVTPPGTSFSSFSLSVTVASSGTHTIAFAGTSANTNATFIDAVTLTAVVPGTTLASSLNPAKQGKTVIFTATVSGTNPTGTVGFTSNGSTISGCSAASLSGGSGNVRTAQCVTSFAVAATYNIVANYSGDGGNAPSASATLVETVNSRH
jgi:hypothetical protein